MADSQKPTNEFGAIGQKVNADEEVAPVEQIESLCVNCGENGITRLLLTSIPYFREIIVMSFYCDHCGFKNSEVQPAGTIQPKGTYHELRLTTLEDFNRQVIKSDTATAKFVELDIEIPAGRGQLTNVEGLLSTIISDLEFGQDTRKEQSEELHAKVQAVINKARKVLNGECFPFRVYVDDPAGNSFIAPNFRDGVGKWEKHEYARTPEQNAALGLADTDAADKKADDILVQNRGYQPGLTESGDIIPDEVYSFPSTCPACMHNCVTNMKMVDIPHFKQVILMSVVCDACGYRSNDVKTGGEIPERGRRITLKVQTSEDLSRDILKSEACTLECPELTLTVNAGTMGGRFTTVEGLLTQIRNDLYSQIFHVSSVGGAEEEKEKEREKAAAEGGDSLSKDEREQWDSFFEKVDQTIAGKLPVTIILSDPIAASYVQSTTDEEGGDPAVTIEEYDRTEEEEEDLGLTDMKTEGYEEDAETEKTEKTEKTGETGETGETEKTEKTEEKTEETKA